MTKKSMIKADDFKMFDVRATQGQAVARAIDNQTPILMDLRLVDIVIEGDAVPGLKKIEHPVAENIEISAVVL